VTSSNATVTTTDGPMVVYVARPDGEPKGAVIVIQEAFGVTGHIESVTDSYAADGYLAVAPHIYHRTGDPTIDYSDFMATMPHMTSLTHAGQSADLTATIAWLDDAGVPSSAVAIVGFCLGGSTALLAGVEHALGAAVTYYGGGRGGLLKGTLGLPPLVELAPNLQTPWLGLFGDKDGGLPPEEVEQLRAAADRAPVATELVRYADADHGFNRDVGHAYDEQAATDARARVDAMLARSLTW